MITSLVFFGSSPFSVPVLQKLLDRKIDIAAVVTTPDKPVGRHLKLTPNPVKLLSQKYQIPVYISYDQLIENCKLKIVNYIALVAAFGRIIPASVLNTFNNQIYNIHPSLLPKYRGPSPLQQQILDGLTDTGVTIIRLDEKMDHGPIVAVEKDVILPTDTAQTLGERLFEKGAELFLNTPLFLPPKLGGRTEVGSTPQDDSLASYTHKLTRESGFIPWPEFNQYLKSNICDLTSKFRAYYPWPGVWTINPQGNRVKIISINPLSLQTST
jgi:methionyl-tRNA formyltransferase